MNTLERLQASIVGILAEKGSLGETLSTIENELPMSVLSKYRRELKNGPTWDTDALRLVLGQMVLDGSLKVEAPGGLCRYVLTPRNVNLELEIVQLKERMARLENQSVGGLQWLNS